MQMPLGFVVGETRDAIRRVEENASDDWKEKALAAVELTCHKMQTFISDDIWAVSGLESTREDRALGPIMLQASRLKWCKKTDRVRPSRRSHLSGKPVWESLLYVAQHGRQS